MKDSKILTRFKPSMGPDNHKGDWIETIQAKRVQSCVKDAVTNENTTGGSQISASRPISIEREDGVNVWPRSWAQAIDQSIVSSTPKKSVLTPYEDRAQASTTQARSIPDFQVVNQWPRSWKAATDVAANSVGYSILSIGSSRKRNDSVHAFGTPASFDSRLLQNSLDNDTLQTELLIGVEDKMVSFREPPTENDRRSQDGYVLLPQELPDKEEEYVKITEGGGSSMLATILNGMNILCGIGMLATPYAVSASGTGSLIIVSLLAIACCFTGVLLRKCMDISGPWCQAYPDIGLAAFGKTGRIAVAIMLCLELLSCSVEVIILGGQNLAQQMGQRYLTLGFIRQPELFWYIATGLILLPLAWIQNMKWLSLASSGGILSSLVIMSLVFALGITENSFDNLAGSKFIQGDGVLVAIGLYCFCFSGHSVFPNLYRSLKRPQNFNPSLMIVFAVVTILYVAMGLIGYNTFGGKVTQQVTMSMTINYPHAVPSRIAGWLVMINPFSSYPLFLSPVALVLEELLPQNLQGSKFLMCSFGIRSCLVAFTVLMAMSVPFFAYFGALVGCVLSVTISYILPCLFYIKICKVNGVKISKLVFALCIIVPIIGIVVGSIGTFMSLQAILQLQ